MGNEMVVDGTPGADAGTMTGPRPRPAAPCHPTRLRVVRVLWAAILVACFSLLPHPALAQQLTKSIEGRVLAAGSGPAPLPGAIIYLQDQKTNVIKTLIAIADGSYHFSQLPADTDYQVWAEFQGKKSKVRLISSFDTKRDVTLDLRIGK